MAYDEIIDEKLIKEFKAEFPTVSKIEISIESNPQNIPEFRKNFIRKLSLNEPHGRIGNNDVKIKFNFCANPKCYGNQISLADLCNRTITPAGGSIKFSEYVQCLGNEVRRPLTAIERLRRIVGINKRESTTFEFDGFLLDFKLHGTKCKNILLISGTIEFDCGNDI
jgi:hypothetical protein